MKKKILLADDDPDTLLLLGKILQNKGYDVQCLNNATSIVNGMNVWPDLFILDKEMMLIDGIAICKFLKLHNIARNIPIVMISGCDCKAKATSAGVDYYMNKPFDLQELLTVVDKCINS
jgi:DNA-binding response OmpR family regulator